MTNEELLRIAREKYPIGTKFIPAHINSKTDYCIVTSNNFEIWGDNSILNRTDTKEFYSKDKKQGNTDFVRLVYADGKWAEIISYPEGYKKCEDLYQIY